MQVTNILLGALLGLLHGVSSAPAPDSPSRSPSLVDKRTTPSTTVSNNVIFSPPSNAGWTDPRVLYSRVIELTDGSLLATWENYSPEPPLVYFPIYKSFDGGVTWAEVGKVEDQVNDWGMRYQPTLYQLPQAIGNYAAGTILCAGNSIPTDLSQTKIDVYASTDGGVTWEFVSSVASGGEAYPTNGLTPIWEPYLMVYNDMLICYYSDQRDSKYGQKLVHQTTTDLLSWTDVVDDVHDDSNYAARPGMPGLALLPNGQYIFTYEACGTDGCRLHYRLTSDPLNVLSATAYSLVSTSGTRPVSSPYVVWSSVGGSSGTIIVSSGSQSNIFVNQNLGAAGSWVEYSVPQPNAYSRGLMLFEEDDSLLAIIGAGYLPPSSTNKVSISVVDLNDLGL